MVVRSGGATRSYELPAEVRATPVDEIWPCPENERLYAPVDPEDPDVQALAESIRKHGIREPLVITEDDYILSGHRRFVAAKLAGLDEVPCRTEAVWYIGGDRGEIVRLLREYNIQRVKSLDEILREEVVSADPDQAYTALVAHRQQRSDMSDRDVDLIAMTRRRGRKRISSVKRLMLEAAIRVIDSLCDFWPLSDRQIHYGLLNDPPLKNSSKPSTRYVNDKRSYQNLCDLLTRARLDGAIPWEAIADTTRPITRWQTFGNAQDFIRKELADLFGNYWRDLQRTQPNHIEIVAEKLTVQTIVRQVAMKYCIPVTIGRGYCSIMPRREMAQRFKKSGKSKLILLVVSDFDPDGEVIAESFARSMRDDFGIEELVPIKVALAADQVVDLNLEPQMEAKRGSPQYRKFVEQHGTDVFELEAVAPEDLQELLTDAIDEALDVEAFNAEVDAERNEAAFLKESRQRACLALGNLGDPEGDAE